MKKLTILCLLAMSIALLLAGCAKTDTSATTKQPEKKVELQSYTITAPKDGKIIGLISEKGERISKDQPLFAIADEKIDEQVKNLTTQVALAEAELKRMENGIAVASAPIDTTALANNVTTAQNKAAKMNNLLAAGAVSRNQAQAAQLELQQAVAALQAASASQQAQIQKASPEAQEEQKKKIEALKKQLAEAQQAQQANEALSPCTGTIVEIKQANDSIVTKGQDVLVIKEEADSTK